MRSRSGMRIEAVTLVTKHKLQLQSCQDKPWPCWAENPVDIRIQFVICSESVFPFFILPRTEQDKKNPWVLESAIWNSYDFVFFLSFLKSFFNSQIVLQTQFFSFRMQRREQRCSLQEYVRRKRLVAMFRQCSMCFPMRDERWNHHTLQFCRGWRGWQQWKARLISFDCFLKIDPDWEWRNMGIAMDDGCNQGHVKCPLWKLPEAGQEWTMMDNEKLTKLRAWTASLWLLGQGAKRCWCPNHLNSQKSRNLWRAGDCVSQFSQSMPTNFQGNIGIAILELEWIWEHTWIRMN